MSAKTAFIIAQFSGFSRAFLEIYSLLTILIVPGVLNSLFFSGSTPGARIPLGNPVLFCLFTAYILERLQRILFLGSF